MEILLGYPKMFEVRNKEYCDVHIGGSVIMYFILNHCCLTTHSFNESSNLKLAIMGMHRSLAKQDEFTVLLI
jgi:hypothetical protein